jgi:hypothetical protein
MSSLQYVIDSICSSVTGECIYKMIEGLAAQGPTSEDEIIPLIRSKDLSLDAGSARLIARAALEEMAQKGDIRIEGDVIRNQA